MQADRSDSEARDIKNGKTQKPYPDFRLSDLPGTAALVVLIFVIGASVFAYHFVNERSAKITFVTGATFSFVGLLVIIAQTIIYVQQAGFMKQQSKAMKDSVERTDTIIEKMQLQLEEMRTENAALAETLEWERAKNKPRLRIDAVGVAGFDIGNSPAFIVTLVNDGATDAQDVALYVQAEHKRIRAEWRGEQIITVPANERKIYPIRWTPVLSQQVIDTYNEEPLLKVFGYFTYEGVQQPFCYHYYPWTGARPADVPYFVPCDFDVRNDVNIGLELQDSTHGHVTDNLVLGQGSKSEPNEGNKSGKDKND